MSSTLPPVGHYLANEVGWLAGVSGDQIGQWARYGYIRSSQSSKVPRIYSYQDVAEAMMVHELLERGVSYKTLAQVISSLRTDVEDWPLQSAHLLVPDASDATVVLGGQQYFDIGKRPWHGVLTTADLVLVTSQLNRGGWAIRDLPDLRHIEVTPDRLSGRPTIRGRRLAAEDVAEMADTPEGMIVLLEQFRLSKDEISDAKRWWERVSEYELAA